jgi:radical SAM protein with 4Fe4S-binding SPASM domain
MADPNFFCKRPWTGFEIEHDGSVKPCCMSRETSCGNVNASSVEEIWNGEKFRRLRELMASGQSEKICKPDCPRFHSNFDDATPYPVSPGFSLNFELNENEIRER